MNTHTHHQNQNEALAQAVRIALGDGEGSANLLEGWTATQATLPADLPFYLHEAYIAQAGDDAGFDPTLTASLQAAAARVGLDPAARALSWHIYRRVFHEPGFTWGVPDRWPFPSGLVGEHATLFYLLAALGGMREARAIHAAHGVPREVARATFNDMQRWAAHFRRGQGMWGLNPRQLAWLSHHMRGELYHLGRLQYEMGTWDLAARAYRHISGQVVALSEGGVQYRADGQRDGAGGVHHEEGTWTAHLEQDEDAVRGHRVLPWGQAERSETRLSLREWRQVLGPGDAVLHLHIPRGEPLEEEACRRSLEEALEFFPRCFPEFPFVAFSCHSWILDPQLQDWLPASSNLVRFQRQVYLLPVRDDGNSPFYFIFDGMPADLRHAPRETTLQRALLDHVLAGHRWRGAGCFLLPEDLTAWGGDTYLRQAEIAGPGPSES